MFWIFFYQAQLRQMKSTEELGEQAEPKKEND